MKTILLLTLLQLGAAGNDAYWTHRNVGTWPPYGNERNPVARPFVSHTPTLALFFGVNVGVRLEAERLLRKHHHNKLALALALETAGENLQGGIYSAKRSK